MSTIDHGVADCASLDEARAPARVEEVAANVRRFAQEFGASADVIERGYRVLIAGFAEAELAAHRRQPRA